MPKRLPYFKWYTSEAMNDEKYAAMTDAELGFYHRCLNRSWDNQGLPQDLDELAGVMRVTREYLDQIWKRVGRCFVVSDESSRLVNPRQEKERAEAIELSEKNKRPGNANAAREKRDKNAIGTPEKRDRDLVAFSGVSTNEKVASQRAYESESLTTGTEDPKKEKKKAPPIDATLMRARFSEWIKPWARNPSEERALHAWAFCWTPEDDAAIFTCRDRYMASRDVAQGVWLAPAKFLYEQKENGWKGMWPPARASPRAQPLPAPTREDELKALRWLAENDPEGEGARQHAREQLRILEAGHV